MDEGGKIVPALPEADTFETNYRRQFHLYIIRRHLICMQNFTGCKRGYNDGKEFM